MRHTFDADHIAAIDNTTRKLLNEGKRPLSVGFFFSLGHSTIVFVMAVLLNFGIRALDEQVKNSGSGLHNITNIVGTGVSGFFLYIITALNVVILVSILRVFMDLRRGKYNDDERRAAAKARADEPFLRPAHHAHRHALEDVPDRRALRARLRHGD